MATVTQCDKCKETSSVYKLNRWVEVRYADGMLPTFLGYPNHKLNICEPCFEEFKDWFSNSKDK